MDKYNISPMQQRLLQLKLPWHIHVHNVRISKSTVTLVLSHSNDPKEDIEQDYMNVHYDTIMVYENFICSKSIEISENEVVKYHELALKLEKLKAFK